MRRVLFSALLLAMTAAGRCGEHQPQKGGLLKLSENFKPDMFLGRDLKPHDRDLNDPTFNVLVAAVGDAYASIDPYRSLLIYDRLHDASSYSQPDFGICHVLGDALGQNAALTTGKAWFNSITGEDSSFRNNESQAWGGSLCSGPLNLLAVVNRMDLATSETGERWSKAELRFVYAARKDFTVILEFVLPEMSWEEFQQVAHKWAGLSAASPTGIPFGQKLADTIKATGYDRSGLMRLRINRSFDMHTWILGEWDFSREQPLAVSPLDQQLSKNMLNSDDFRVVAANTAEDADSVNLPPPFATGIKRYSNYRNGMALPSGIPLTSHNIQIRRMAALQQCVWCHTTESGTEFAHINAGNEGTPSLSAFLAGGRPNKPTIEQLYYPNCDARPAVVSCVAFKFDYADGQGNLKEQPELRRFHDLGRRLLYLSAIISAPAGRPPDSKWRELIRALRTNYTH